MPSVADFAGSELLRPLLNCSRDELLTWAQQHNLSWIEDESNQDDAYDRNFLRLRVVPVLTRRWPHFAQAVARSAALCGEQEQLLDELLAAELSALVTDEGTLLLAPLESMSAVKRAALLRRWLSMHTRQMPSREMLGRIWQEVAQAREDAAPCLRLGDFEIRRYQQQLWWLPLQQRYAEAIFPWGDISEPLILPSAMGALALEPGGTLRAPAHDEVVTIRFKASGVLHIVGRQGGRKLKKIWQELGVAPWRRDTTPLLFYGETLIAAAGVFITREGLADEGQGLALTWRKNGQ
jgi:tRNA(Ile)-lysidine synthase